MSKKFVRILLTVCLAVIMMPAMTFAGQSEGSMEAATLEKAGFNSVRTTDEVSGINEALPAEKEKLGTLAERERFARTKATTQAMDASASVNGVEYDNLFTAVDEAPAGATVKVLQSLNLSDTLVINKPLTLDLGGNYLITDEAICVIEVNNANVTIKNGYVHIYYKTDSATAAINVWGNSNVQMDEVYLNSVRPNSDGIFINQGSKVTMNHCEYTNSLDNVYTQLVPDITTVQDYNVGAYVYQGGMLEMNNCYFDVFGCSYGVWAEGTVSINDCYIVQVDSEYSTTNYYGIAVLAKDYGTVTIDDGYFYGENPVWINNATASVKVLEGWFESYWIDDPAFSGYTDQLIIPSGYRANETNWEELGNVDSIWVYRNAAPSTVTTNLTAADGQSAGYDDIKATWSSVSGVDGYKVYYKKSSASSYTLLKTVATGKTRSATKKNLSDGVKYYFKVVPYVKIADKVLTDDYILTVNCSKYKTDYTYTLKKLSTPTVSKSGSKVKVKWKNISGETGYQISQSTKKSGTNIVSTYKTTSGTYKTISATKGKTYYYKVRAYKTVDGKKIYGPWSDVKSYKRS